MAGDCYLVPNVVITTAMKVNLIDFDWASDARRAQCPCLISPEIHWPQGTGPLVVIETVHVKPNVCILHHGLDTKHIVSDRKQNSIVTSTAENSN
jgi:hypothetical protein